MVLIIPAQSTPLLNVKRFFVRGLNTETMKQPVIQYHHIHGIILKDLKENVTRHNNKQWNRYMKKIKVTVFRVNMYQTQYRFWERNEALGYTFLGMKEVFLNYIKYYPAPLPNTPVT